MPQAACSNCQVVWAWQERGTAALDDAFCSRCACPLREVTVRARVSFPTETGKPIGREAAALLKQRLLDAVRIKAGAALVLQLFANAWRV